MITSRSLNQSQLIIKARSDHGATLEQLGELFDCTKQRIQQVEKGVHDLPIERIEILASNKHAPEWARNLAFQLWMLCLIDDYAEMFAQLETLGRIVFPNNGAKRT
ncbi:MAG TPA: helix-turn-helix transcriptional regulator [Anaerolineales bacterium]|nr:helix-turn-helix transcriptional regulator [Anaerolineales bacterium]